MNSFLIKSGKLSVIYACIAFLVVSASAQISLRKALDYDADGRADYAVFRPGSNTWFINKSGGGVTVEQFGSSSADYQTPGDFDGDGKSDVSVWRSTDGVWYRINSGTNTFSTIAFGTTGDEPVAGDYDGDGTTDLAVVRRSNGVMIWYLMRSQAGPAAIQFGNTSDSTAPGDYDGDLKIDIAVQRAGANSTDPSVFYILNSNGGSVRAESWGRSNDLVVPGDYDGDGKTDVAVIREGATSESTIVWYIRKSSDGGALAYTFGTTGTDVAVQNDYDGDGKTDVAVWRETSGSYYILNSGDGLIRIDAFGTARDIPVASYDTH